MFELAPLNRRKELNQLQEGKPTNRPEGGASQALDMFSSVVANCSAVIGIDQGLTKHWMVSHVPVPQPALLCGLSAMANLSQWLKT